ncbi:uncharacterized protein HD556DRAFT_1425692 [Suillus plorans]|uniref:Uncharacterized protein n=1 Tax=Suillus plorans TaxID=116603 RepID=A0A9P7A9D9_9AGAM|nr:uncharacterized protein HD556DRAFT_1425692 [Suillus plorans]KAG1784839.1 hypothetical protein HD556DRAFT_1425692 [Suillus plorans]
MMIVFLLYIPLFSPCIATIGVMEIEIRFRLKILDQVKGCEIKQKAGNQSRLLFPTHYYARDYFNTRKVPVVLDVDNLFPTRFFACVCCELGKIEEFRETSITHSSASLAEPEV